ncbi:SDR family oxidoreductase [Pararhizobium mangrovi]|uniref:SDR family NAD(P)-dependent oxidoreductase n=1 Tax=Pararhizobium mangrovi TaxID=2590452 RepID=A0A506U3W6_9HYPH|nr:SDR family NAD(P)-dependent oxidoreductase [Pararhizobium mangrovi]TPW27724.1 SDR family NAD(P)-dependent oxidoreductase [Pararhizobium mangrovi]
MNMTGNTILVTGATSGIGRALAEAFHDRGNTVVVTGRRTSHLEAITADRPAITGIILDIGDGEAVAACARDVGERFPDLNIVLANAGISRTEDMSAQDWNASDAQAIVDTNILGVIRTATAFLPLLRQRRDATFLATSSNLAFIPRADFPTYCASKAFLHSWLQSLRHQLRHVPVEVLELAPPYVRTELTGTGQASDERAMALDVYVAEVIDILERQAHPAGEILVERDRARRFAERDGRYEETFAAMNPN